MIESQFLATISIFSSLSTDELTQFASDWTLVQKGENETLFKQGDPGNKLYILVNGSVTVSIPALSGELLSVATLHSGDLLGELTLFDLAKRTANAVTAEPTTLIVMSHDRFIAFLKKHPDVAVAMLAKLAERLRKADEFMSHQVVRNANVEMESRLKYGERLADRFSAFIGSWTFLCVFLTMLLSWIGLNVYALYHPVDPYPFTLLNLMLSCLAAFQAPVIMMSQGRQAAKDHLASELDYQVNLKAEMQIQAIRLHIDRMNKLDVKNFREIRKIQDAILEQQKLLFEQLKNH